MLVLLLVVLIGSGAPAGRDGRTDVDAACVAAMGPYYAALLASARGDGDGTLRQVLLLKSRWDEIIHRPAPDLPIWLRDTGAGQPLGTAVAAKIDAARQHLPRAVAAAHGDLEAIRALLRDARTRHGARTLDDAVTDYHEAMERLANGIGGSNEIVLSPADFISISEAAARARLAWTAVASSPELRQPPAGWTDIAAATANVLATIAAAADRRDAAAMQQGAQGLKSRYFDLLTLLSHRA